MTTSTSSAPVYSAATVAELLGLRYTAQELAVFGPPPQPIEGFITFFDPRLSWRQLEYALVGTFATWVFEDWKEIQPYLQPNRASKPGYRQLRLAAVRHSMGKSFPEQQGLLLPREEVPTALTVMTGKSIYFLATGKRLSPSWVRCQDVCAEGNRICVGNFEEDGVGVIHTFDDESVGHLLGLASCLTL